MVGPQFSNLINSPQPADHSRYLAAIMETDSNEPTQLSRPFSRRCLIKSYHFRIDAKNDPFNRYSLKRCRGNHRFPDIFCAWTVGLIVRVMDITRTSTEARSKLFHFLEARYSMSFLLFSHFGVFYFFISVANLNCLLR